ncbi:two-component system, OmpR family, KDP operon response regulator KdpE [Amycolatopsis xylanica]|uniref:Two-component system, OmpR family, KDP operon response regulator KdpE n=1 Tax=Amycolatopsis xylanica TaxID=589385 RepID=A0A1H2V4G4_9PSEU|nr:response regulator [Amycolatopsis xylanica]SDW63187.1 two-component system, OmpR family, KDP operon response regulator KdpE [Amycolatopsis xylanica]
MEEEPTCPVCGGPLPAMPETGRPRKFCSDRCRTRAHRSRERSQVHHCQFEVFGRACDRAVEFVVTADGQELKVCAVCRELAWTFLNQQRASVTTVAMRRIGDAPDPPPSSVRRGRALYIEDDDRVRGALIPALERRGYLVKGVASGREGMSHLETAGRDFDVILLDLGLPDMDGMQLLRRLRLISDIPVIILSARGEQRDQLLGLTSGADDYLVKPFSIDELVVRMRTVLRRTSRGQDPQVFDDGLLYVDSALKIAQVASVTLKLTESEFQLLDLLVRPAGATKSVTAIVSAVWPGESPGNRAGRVAVLVARLRQKLAMTDLGPDAIVSARGVGYFYRPSDGTAQPDTTGRVGYSHAERILNQDP